MIRMAVQNHLLHVHASLSVRERSELADSAYAEHVKRSNVTAEP